MNKCLDLVTLMKERKARQVKALTRNTIAFAVYEGPGTAAAMTREMLDALEGQQNNLEFLKSRENEYE